MDLIHISAVYSELSSSVARLLNDAYLAFSMQWIAWSLLKERRHHRKPYNAAIRCVHHWFYLFKIPVVTCYHIRMLIYSTCVITFGGNASSALMPPDDHLLVIMTVDNCCSSLDEQVRQVQSDHMVCWPHPSSSEAPCRRVSKHTPPSEFHNTMNNSSQI